MTYAEFVEFINSGAGLMVIFVLIFALSFLGAWWVGGGRE